MPNQFTMNPARMIAHPQALERYLSGADILPITLEFSPAAACNHACWWCSSGYDKDAKGNLSFGVVDRTLVEAKGLGCQAVIWSGGGEPTLNRDFARMLERAHALGLDNGVHTNLSTSSAKVIEALAACALWIRVSAEAADSNTYLDIHRRDHFKRMVKNIETLVQRRAELGRTKDLVVGAQIVVSIENADSLEFIGKFYRELGIDYLQLHPVTFNPQLLTHWEEHPGPGSAFADKYTSAWYRATYDVIRRLEDDFITVKHDQWLRCIEPGEDQPFSRCYATYSPFIEGDGQVYYCPDTKRQQRFALGNINTHTLTEIWAAAQRRSLLGDTGCGAQNIDISGCHKVCVKRPLNIFLAQLANDPRSQWSELSPLWGDVQAPTPHRNFV